MQSEIIDFHTHAFSDNLAARAVKTLSDSCGGISYYSDGTVRDLLKSMDRAGIEKSVVCSIATKPKQFKPILDWSLEVQTDRIIPLASVHPADEERNEHIRQVKNAGLKGIKLHPFYQNFYIDEDSMLSFYEEVCRNDLILTIHTGYDIAFPRIRRADPQKIIKITKRFPELKLITTHFGAWQMWEEVESEMIGKKIYIELSFALDYLPEEKAKAMLEKHPEDFLLFGTDSPWTDQKHTLNLLEKLNLSSWKMEKILTQNAKKLLGMRL